MMDDFKLHNLSIFKYFFLFELKTLNFQRYDLMPISPKNQNIDQDKLRYNELLRNLSFRWNLEFVESLKWSP